MSSSIRETCGGIREALFKLPVVSSFGKSILWWKAGHGPLLQCEDFNQVLLVIADSSSTA